jgi:transcriptional regulator with XRE-family HTH domain
MRIACHLRAIRGNRTMKQIAQAADADGARVSLAVLSQVERGLMLPPDAVLPALEAAYGAPITDWYEPRVLLVLQADEDNA